MTGQRLSSSDSDAPSAGGTHLCSSIEFQEIAKAAAAEKQNRAEQGTERVRERGREREDEGM